MLPPAMGLITSIISCYHLHQHMITLLIPFLKMQQHLLLHDAWPSLRFEGKPQCHIIPIAKERGEIAVSVGCMLSRVRTGISNNEVTCAIPASRLSELIERLRAARIADERAAAYAAEDSKRFARQQ